uniref:C2H2-type domain-containing protein n=1 Tax=Globodera rostochiensis TaxID=31243 RepID=A0A914GSL0_GLORO
MDHPSRDIRPTEAQLLKALPFCDGEPSSSKKAPICGICGKTFKNRGSMRFHMQRAHKTEFVDGENGTLDSILGFRRDGNCTIGGGGKGEAMRFHCPLEGCRRRDGTQQHFASAKLLVQHFQKKHTEKRHRCSECSARFALARDLRYHQKKVCPNAKRVICAETSIPNSNSRLPTTAEPTPNAAQSAIKVFLVPVKFDQRMRFRRIFPRLAAVERRTVATQTGDHRPQNVYSLRQQIAPQFCAESSPSGDTFYTESAVGASSQFGHRMHKNNNLFGELLQFQNAHCQTNYQPKTTTIDFAAQWPSGAIPSGVNSFSSSSIYLPPLVTSSTQTAQMLHQCSQTIANDPPTATDGHNAKCSLLLQTAATQTYAFSQRLPPFLGDGMDSNCCWATAPLDEAALCASVSAQTDANWTKEMPRVG